VAARGLEFLSTAVPRWPAENGCYACHHHGDAARALLVGRRLGYPVPEPALTDTVDWLAHPDRWRHNGGDGPFNDQKLAAVQFTAALVEAIRADRAKPDRLAQALALVVPLQRDDGSWQLRETERLGGAASYGPVLTTAMCIRMLQSPGAEAFHPQLARAQTWLRRQRPQTVLDAAAVVFADDTFRPEDQTEHCLDVIRRGETPGSGGWGPYVHSPPEPFDTAVVLLALCALEPRLKSKQTAIDRAQLSRSRVAGSHWLEAQQLDDGSWPETTRPPGGVSEPLRVSTTAWATLALMSCHNVTTPPPRSTD
jgi:hypothetical protein